MSRSQVTFNRQPNAGDAATGKGTVFRRVVKDLRINRELYIIFMPVLVFYLIFHYAPMYGAVIAFKNYRPAIGIAASPWVGMAHFNAFFSSYYFWILLRNTLVLSFSSLLFGFPAPVLLALLINELKSKRFARTVQTITYMPHFISLVVVCGMIIQFTKSNGFITNILTKFGYPQQSLLSNPKAFVPIYVISGIWQEVGWGSIIYLAALAGIDQELYEAAEIDGAGRFKKAVHITMPGIMPTIVVLFIMRVGRIMSMGGEKVILLYNPSIYDTADVISSYVYRRGIENTDWSFSSAVGLFNSVISFALVVSVNSLSKRVSQMSLW
ncbi:MAG: ABC transporter permease [Christensenellales bacterium]|jgi:putative aldouronate transport system permease protein